MGDKSAIEWTDATWNPVTGCTKVSPGCRHCYAERFARRLQAMGNKRYRNGFAVTLHPDQIDLPLRWREPRRIFVNSMSDLFHESVPEAFIARVFDVMVRASWHVFQVMTKRAERLAALGSRLPWPDNVWQGVSVENARYTSRIAPLQAVPARVRFLSVEPLLVLDPYGLHLDWKVIQSAGLLETVEIFLNFPIMDMNRNVLWRTLERVAPREIERMTSFWGDDSWRQIAYETAGNLFGFKEKTPNDTVAEAFQDRLRRVAGFGYVPAPLPMRNSSNAVVYSLFFASPNQNAARIVTDIFARYRRQ